MRNEGSDAAGLGVVGLFIGKSLPIEMPRTDAFALIIWDVAITELARLGLILIGHGEEQESGSHQKRRASAFAACKVWRRGTYF